MKQSTITYPAEKPAMYKLLKTQLQGLIDGVPHILANLANASALLNQALTKINWVGFYLMEDGQALFSDHFRENLPVSKLK